jgi:hypothetical protein
MAGNNNAKLWREAVSATSDCPPIAVLEKVMEGASQPVSDDKLAAHVRQCPHCQSEISMLRSFESATPSQDEGAAVAWIATQLERNQQTRSGSEQHRSMLVLPWRNFFRLPYMAAAAALVLAAALGISLYISENSRPTFNGNYGTSPMRSGSIRLTGPSGELAQSPSQFTWGEWPGASSYTVKITGMDMDHTLVWQGTSSHDFLVLPPEVKALIRPGKPLEIIVIAFDTGGHQLASGKSHFRVALK